MLLPDGGRVVTTSGSALGGSRCRGRIVAVVSIAGARVAMKAYNREGKHLLVSAGTRGREVRTYDDVAVVGHDGVGSVARCEKGLFMRTNGSPAPSEMRRRKIEEKTHQMAYEGKAASGGSAHEGSGQLQFHNH